MPVKVDGPGSPLERGFELCTECGEPFALGTGTNSKRCPKCRRVWASKRPDRKVHRRPQVCTDCKVAYQPPAKGQISERCPTCRAEHRKRTMRESARQSRLNGKNDKPRRLTSRMAECEICKVEWKSASKGRLPTLCSACRKKNAATRELARKDSNKQDGIRSWIRPMYCRDCGEEIPAAEPGKRRSVRCDKCRSAHRKPYQLDPRKNRDKHLRRMYGISLLDFEAMANTQGWLCAICGNKPEVLHVDHDHDSRKIRGLVCGSCNRLMGLALDSPEILRSAAKYLELERGKNDPEGL